MRLTLAEDGATTDGEVVAPPPLDIGSGGADAALLSLGDMAA